MSVTFYFGVIPRIPDNMSIWAHFVVSTNKEDTKKAECKHCTSRIAYSAKTSSNLMTHLKRKHRDIYLSLQQKPIVTPPNQSTMQEFTTVSRKYGPHDPKQQRITDALVMFIAGDLLPLSLVESENFRRLLEALDPRYSVPGRKNFTTNLLQNKKSEVYAAIKSELEQAQAVSITLDLWSSRQMRGYIGITGHYVLDWKLNSVLLCCSRFRGRHTADNISQHLDETKDCFDIESKVTNIATDNATNMMKALSLPGFEDIEPEVNSEPEIEDTYDEVPQPVDIAEEVDHVPCFAHTLQLVIKDGLNKAGPIQKVLGKAAKIVSHVRKSTNATCIMEGDNKLQAATVTRWNSQLYMVRSLLKASKDKLQQLDCPQLTSSDRSTLEELSEILTPFETATNLVQGDNIVTSSMVVPCVHGLKNQLEQLTSKYSNRFVDTLKSSFEKRISHYAEKDVFVLVTALDPRFKTKWCNGTRQEQLEAKLVAKAHKVAKVASNPAAGSDKSPVNKKTKIDFLDMFFAAPKSENSSPSVQTEVQDYLTQPCLERSKNPLAYWQNQETTFPHLAQLASKYLAVPASSAPVERIFSVGGKIFRPDRCRLSDSVFENLMFVRCNKHLLKM